MSLVKASNEYPTVTVDNSFDSTPRANSIAPIPLIKPLNEDDSPRKKTLIRLTIFVLCLTVLVVGRSSVPDNNPPCLVDKIQDWLQGANNFILNNAAWRDALQILCSSFMDVMFLSTGAYWVFRGNSSRLIITTLVFYIVRAIIQSIWFSPFPTGYWWEDPGFPSLVVPYGRGSDFFFSGHIGFVVICASEWKKNGFPLASKIIALGGVYTAFILLIYRIHYSIDVFTGITFSHYVFILVDEYKTPIDNALIKFYDYIRAFIFGNSSKAKKDSEQELL